MTATNEVIFDYRQYEQILRALEHIGDHFLEAPDLRDKFAIAALQGLIANEKAGPDWRLYGENPEIGFANWSYRYADAMLKARLSKEVI